MNLSSLYLALPPKLRRMAKSYFSRTPMAYTLPSGVIAEVGDRCDWAIYNDVFVVGEYDRAIAAALETRAKEEPLRVVDLGANVGYFLLRLLDKMRTTGSGLKAEGLALEGAAETYAKLVARVGHYPELSGVRLQQRLAGLRSGTAYIDSGENSAGATVGDRPKGGSAVEYLDLEPCLEAYSTIDLVKCDIEGSEETLVRTYPHLLDRVKHLVIELHPMYCDTAFVKQAITRSGLVMQTSVIGPHQGENCLFSRTPACLQP